MLAPRNLHATCCGFECDGNCNKVLARWVIEMVNSRKVQSMMKRHPYVVAMFIFSYFVLLSMTAFYLLKNYWNAAIMSGDRTVRVVRTLRGGGGSLG